MSTSTCYNNNLIFIRIGQWQTGFWFGLHPPTEELGFRLLKVQCQQKNHLANEVYHDISMLIEWIEYIYEKEGIPLNTENGYYPPLVEIPPILRRVLHLLNLACDIYDRTKSLSSLKLAIQSIYERITTTSSPPPPGGGGSDGECMKICRVGHAHMDLVWMWPERVTYQKIIHTYSNVLQLMNTYPDFTFTMSQPPLFYHIQKTQPELAYQIQHRISDGRWEFTGALEVESDTQLPVGEGLVRCILYGQERIRSIRGSVSETVWIPDVFGYSQCLPQVCCINAVWE
jgi:alpha-mannosidase